MGAWQRIGVRRRLSVAATAAVLALGVTGCAPDVIQDPLRDAADVVTGVLGQVDAVAVQTAAMQAMSSVLAFVVEHQQLPATLAEAGFTVPEGVSVEIVPTGGIGFSVCASSSDHAFKAESGTVSAVDAC